MMKKLKQGETNLGYKNRVNYLIHNFIVLEIRDIKRKKKLIDKLLKLR